MVAPDANLDSADRQPDTCLDSLYLHSPTKRRILLVLRTAKRVLSPKEVFELLSMEKLEKQVTRSTVRNNLRAMRKEGSVKQPLIGSGYVDTVTYGVMISPIVCHNLRLRFKPSERIVSWESTVDIQGVKVHVCFGEQHQLVRGLSLSIRV